MAETEGRPKGKWVPLAEAGVAAAGMCLFALFVRSRPPLVLLSIGGLLAAAIAIVHCVRTEPSPAVALGFGGSARRIVVYTVSGFVIGAALGFLDRWKYAGHVLPTTLTLFAPVAALIGATEEVVYRGYVQGRLRVLGPLPAIALAALGHTAYKCALFALSGASAQVDLGILAGWTFLGGLLFGALRERAGSVLPPVIAHACFDIVVYGELAHAPWWVWT